MFTSFSSIAFKLLVFATSCQHHQTAENHQSERKSLVYVVADAVNVLFDSHRLKIRVIVVEGGKSPQREL